MHQKSPIIETLDGILSEDTRELCVSRQDAKLFIKIIKSFPKCFPVPDIFYTRASGHFDSDITLQYYMKEGEKSEPLRQWLSMVFGTPDWFGVLDKDDGSFTVRTMAQLKDVNCFLIVEANQDDYEFVALTDKGTCKTGPVSVKRFVPYDIIRSDITPGEFHKLQLQTGLTGSLLNWWIDLLSRLILTIPEDTPAPDYVQGSFSDEHDVDFVYSDDTCGHIRKDISGIYPDAKWFLNWDKKEGEPTLCTILTVQGEPNITIKVTLELPDMDDELLLFVEENDKVIYYRTVRDTDTDFEEILGQKYEQLD